MTPTVARAPRLLRALLLILLAASSTTPADAQAVLAAAPDADGPSLPARSELRIHRASGRVADGTAHAAPARRARVLDTLGLAHLALRQRRIELVPALEQLSGATHDRLVARPLLAGAAAELRGARARAGVEQLLDRTAASLDAMCADAREGRRRSCRAMAIDLAAARAHVKAGRKVEARRALASLAQRADLAAKRGELEPWEGTVLGETARYAIERV